jgi:dihydrofolate synthase/folylpolyglutamate synthase
VESRALAELLARLEAQGVRLGLERFRRLLAGLGSPERAVPALLVGGTNGKGSTVALLATLFRLAGRRVGLYTSPHLEHPSERIRVDGLALSEAELEALLAEVVAVAERLEGEPPTYFEAFTAAAWLAFARAGCEVAVLEVGMGGRLDATNAGAPVVSVVTSIALDHEEHLGSGHAAIAGEKAQIFRRGRPALVGPTPPEARAVLAQTAQTLGAVWHELVAEVAWEPALPPTPEPVGLRATPRRPVEDEVLQLTTPAATYVVRPPLGGRHQWTNLALAVRAGELFAGELGWSWDPSRVAPAVASWRWPGRLEHLTLAAGEVVLDAAHNPAGVAALLAALDQDPFVLLFGALGDKRIGEMLPPLAARARQVVLTKPDSPRALDPAALAVLAGEAAVVEPEVVAALDRAWSAVVAGVAPRLVVCGSIFLVGEVRRALRARFGVLPPAESVRVG